MTECLMSSSEKRKKIRRTLTYPAFINFGDGSPVLECTLCDASQDGAQLAVADPKRIPDEFILALSADGAARRQCRVAWRTEGQIGVEFLKEVKKNGPSTRMQAMRSSVPQPAAAKVLAESALQVDIDMLASR
jgi:hypothetical protein